MSKYDDIANKITNIKSNLAEAVTSKGVATAPSASFKEIATNISQIEQSTGGSSLDGFLEKTPRANNSNNNLLQINCNDNKKVYIGADENHGMDTFGVFYDDNGVRRPVFRIETHGSSYSYIANSGGERLFPLTYVDRTGVANISVTDGYSCQWNALVDEYEYGTPNIDMSGLYKINAYGDIYFNTHYGTKMVVTEYAALSETFKSEREIDALKRAKSYGLSKYPALECLTDAFKKDLDAYIEDKVNALLEEKLK